jgi:hypothetical protein
MVCRTARHHRTFSVRLGDGEHGQVLVLSALCMLVFLAMSALALDTASWYQKHHQAQVAADAAALAAANCMANIGVTSPTFTDQCTTTQDAANVATTYAAQNGVTIPTSDVSFAGTRVTVTTPNPAPSLFAEVFGIGSSTQTAQSTADYASPTKSTCDASMENSGACYFAFAMDQNCPDVGMTLENVGKVRVTGGIWSNSDLETINADSNSNWGNVYYGNRSLCSWIGASVSNGPVFSSGPTPAPPVTTWPRDYTKVLECGPGDAYQCTGPYGTPSYCTQAAPAFGLSGALPITIANNQVYCAYGTSTQMNDPMTWNGVIVATSGTTTTNDSFIGGEVVLTTSGSVTVNSDLSTSLGNLLVYANDTLIPSANVAASGSASLSGDIFAPNGGVTASNAGTGQYLSFLEGSQVVIDAQGKMTGEGPQTGTAGSTSIYGSDSLVG